MRGPLEAAGGSSVAENSLLKPGGKETVNCGDTAKNHRDAHIELLLVPTDTAKQRRVVVEITPRWRAFMGSRGEDWSTPTLKTRLEKKWARFTGWMFFDGEHDDESENTTPNRSENWRATAWEVHPVTAIRVCSAGPMSC